MANLKQWELDMIEQIIAGLDDVRMFIRQKLEGYNGYDFPYRRRETDPDQIKKLNQWHEAAGEQIRELSIAAAPKRAERRAQHEASPLGQFLKNSSGMNGRDILIAAGKNR